MKTLCSFKALLTIKRIKGIRALEDNTLVSEFDAI